jgi:tRNA nucleotidyltransferase/poly(A) polymerase
MTQRLNFDMQLPKDILFIKDMFKTNGFQLVVVGGAVRDAVLGIEPKDFDLATDANPDKVEQILQGAGFNTLATGKAFGVINVFTESGDFEIATFRTDTYIDEEPDLESFKTYLKSLNNGSFEDFMDKLMK